MVFSPARTWIFPLIAAAALAVLSCSPDWKDKATANGRQAILDQANDFLTAGDCDAAINLISPLVGSQWQDNDILMVYASAYACKGGVSFPTIIGNLKDLTGSDIWGTLVKSDYSSGSGDGHVTALDKATSILYQTATPVGNTYASQRTPDANVYMVFIQAINIASVISPLGNANSSTGKKGTSITGKGSVSDLCHVQVGMAIILDSLTYVSAGAALNNVSTNVKAVCAKLPSGSCPTNTDLATCTASAALQLQGQSLINAIDTQWN